MEAKSKSLFLLTSLKYIDKEVQKISSNLITLISYREPALTNLSPIYMYNYTY